MCILGELYDSSGYGIVFAAPSMHDGLQSRNGVSGNCGILSRIFNEQHDYDMSTSRSSLVTSHFHISVNATLLLGPVSLCRHQGGPCLPSPNSLDEPGWR